MLEISVENTCVAGPEACNFIKKRLQYKCFSVKFVKFLRNPVSKNSCERLLLHDADFYFKNKNFF